MYKSLKFCFQNSSSSQTTWKSLIFDRLMIKVHINFISAWSVKAKGQNLFSHQISQTEEDKS